MHKKIALIVCVALGIPAAGHALTFDVRGGYRAGSHSYESRYKVSQGWQNGWWASME
ncbi:TPA: porin, partial [Klebsiella pneumoniae]|nr:porin [Klebsiella pneumoniae]